MTIIKENTDIIIFALSRFDGLYSSSSISLAKEFSKNNRVFYINHPYSLKDLFTSYNSRHLSQYLPALFWGKNPYKNFSFGEYSGEVTMVTMPITLPINFLPAGEVYNWFQQLNERIFFYTLRKLIRDKGISNFIFLNAYNPFLGQNFPSDIRPVAKVYYCMDDIEEAGYTAKHGAALEQLIMGKYDVTLTTSHELLRIHASHASSIFCLPNAVDPDLFNKAFYERLDRPPELAGVTKKVIGYIGNIEQRMDYELVKRIALAHPGKLLYLIGPTSSDEYLTHGLDSISNIIFTGGKKIEELPAYLRYIDCAIIPFRCNKLTRSIYPLKINEYLSGGKPVVTTDFSDAIREFSEVVYISESPENFVELISRAIDEDNDKLARNRVEFSARNSWSERADDFWKIIENYLSDKKAN